MDTEEVFKDDKNNLTTKLVYFVIKEYKFKQDVLYKTMSFMSNLIVDDSTAQSLTPTINSIVETSLKNDQLLLKLIEVLKKHGTTEIDSDLSDDDNNDLSGELMDIIQESSEEKEDLSEILDKKEKEFEKYNEEVSKDKERMDKLDEVSDE